jgi:hypothetical protein
MPATSAGMTSAMRLPFSASLFARRVAGHHPCVLPPPRGMV